MITKFGKRRMQYPDHSNIDFFPLSSYIKIAERIIGHFANRVRPGLANQMLNSEDAISHVAHHIMLAAWNWDQSRGRTLRSYMNYCGFLSIKKYVTKANSVVSKKKNPNKNKTNMPILSLYTEVGSISTQDATYLMDFIENPKAQEPHEILAKGEQDAELAKLLSGARLTDKQEQYLKLYIIDDMTYTEIANYLNTTRQNAQQTVTSALRKLKNV